MLYGPEWLILLTVLSVDSVGIQHCTEGTISEQESAGTRQQLSSRDAARAQYVHDNARLWHDVIEERSPPRTPLGAVRSSAGTETRG